MIKDVCFNDPGGTLRYYLFHGGCPTENIRNCRGFPRWHRPPKHDMGGAALIEKEVPFEGVQQRLLNYLDPISQGQRTELVTVKLAYRRDRKGTGISLSLRDFPVISALVGNSPDTSVIICF